MLRIEQLDHVALAVRDVEASAAWYRETLGLERLYPEWDIPTVVGAGNSGIALFPVRDGEQPAREGMGFRHVAFRLDRESFDRARRELEERGIEARFADHGASHSVYLQDPDGYLVELTTYELEG